MAAGKDPDRHRKEDGEHRGLLVPNQFLAAILGAAIDFIRV
jgi:hypothetical protein